MPLFSSKFFGIPNGSCGSGPRGLGFESRHSDQLSGDHIRGRRIFNLCRDSKDRPERSEGSKQSGGLFDRSWENPLVSGRAHVGMDRNKVSSILKSYNYPPTKIPGSAEADPGITFIFRNREIKFGRKSPGSFPAGKADRQKSQGGWSHPAAALMGGKRQSSRLRSALSTDHARG